jgi:superfamily II DNA or RNA helicase
MENQLRTKISEELLHSDKRHYVLECATGLGKTNLALQKISQLYSQDVKILIVIPRNVLIQNWIEEFKKWHYEDILSNVTFVTYVSLPKMAGSWDIMIADECHHLSERCREALSSFYINHAIFLSATISKDVRQFINTKYNRYNELQWIKVGTKKAIEGEVLPDPMIILYPMTLDNTKTEYLYTPRKPKNKSLKPLVIPYADRWKYKGYKGYYQIKCTQQQYYNEISGIIDWYKRKNYIPAMKNLWLHKAGERLQWLAWQKLNVVHRILLYLKDKRSITFCATIEQTEALNIPCVNSKVGTYNLSRFNEGKIDAISCVNMLDEGANLTDCQIGIFMMLNSSERMQVQKVGKH